MFKCPKRKDSILVFAVGVFEFVSKFVLRISFLNQPPSSPEIPLHRQEKEYRDQNIEVFPDGELFLFDEALIIFLGIILHFVQNLVTGSEYLPARGCGDDS